MKKKYSLSFISFWVYLISFLKQLSENSILFFHYNFQEENPISLLERGDVKSANKQTNQCDNSFLDSSFNDNHSRNSESQKENFKKDFNVYDSIDSGETTEESFSFDKPIINKVESISIFKKPHFARDSNKMRSRNFGDYLNNINNEKCSSSDDDSWGHFI